MTQNTKTLLTIAVLGGVGYIIYKQMNKPKSFANYVEDDFFNYVDDDFFNYVDEDFYNLDGADEKGKK